MILKIQAIWLEDRGLILWEKYSLEEEKKSKKCRPFKKSKRPQPLNRKSNLKARILLERCMVQMKMLRTQQPLKRRKSEVEGVV